MNPSPIYQANTGNTQRLYYAPTGSTQLQQIANPNELQNLAQQGLVEVGKAYQQYDPSSGLTLPGQAPATPAAAPVTTPNAAPPTQNLEVQPGVFSASSLNDFYSNQFKSLQDQQKQLQAALSQIATPDIAGQYNTQIQSQVAPLDEQIGTINSSVSKLDNALRNLESDIRSQIGGRASESVIQARVSAEAQPLIRERQAYVDQAQLLYGQKQNAISNINQQLNFNQQTFENQLKALQVKNDFASQAFDSLNSLMQQGTKATQDAQDRAVSLFSGFIDQSPDFLQQLDAAEIQSLQGGIVPFSVMQKLGTTIKSQQEAIANIPKDAELRTIGGDLYSVQQLPDGTFKTQLILSSGGGGGGGGGGASTSTGVSPEIEQAAKNAYYDEMGKFPSKTDLSNVVARYILKASQFQPAVSRTLGDATVNVNGQVMTAPVFGPGVPDYSGFRPFQQLFKDATLGTPASSAASVDALFNSL